MPKISAPTVVEHRALQRGALLAAATELLVSHGVNAVTPAAVGGATGLARPSVYQYFSSREGIILAIIEESFPPSIASLNEALRGVSAPEDVMDVYLRETLGQAAAGAHRVASALDGAQLSTAIRARLTELHRAQAQPFLHALQEVGVVDLPITAQLLGGTIEAAMKAIEAGADPDTVIRCTTALVRGAVDSARKAGSHFSKR